MYISSVICTVRPKSTSTALSDIKTMLLAKDKRENEELCFTDVKEVQSVREAVVLYICSVYAMLCRLAFDKIKGLISDLSDMWNWLALSLH